MVLSTYSSPSVTSLFELSSSVKGSSVAEVSTLSIFSSVFSLSLSSDSVSVPFESVSIFKFFESNLFISSLSSTLDALRKTSLSKLPSAALTITLIPSRFTSYLPAFVGVATVPSGVITISLNSEFDGVAIFASVSLNR